MAMILGFFFGFAAAIEPCLAYELILKHVKDIAELY